MTASLSQIPLLSLVLSLTLILSAHSFQVFDHVVTQAASLLDVPHWKPLLLASSVFINTPFSLSHSYIVSFGAQNVQADASVHLYP